MGKKNKFENIIAQEKNNEIVIYPEKKEDLYLNFFKSNIDFLKEKERIMFIKHTEDIIRVSDEYGAYIAYLKENIPDQNHCAFHSNIVETDKVKIEMHHGPIFNLFDIVEITLISLLKNNEKISTFRVFEKVLRDHHNNLINTIPLCQTCHIVAHNRKPGVKRPFLMLEHSFGNFVGFLTKYSDCLSYQHINKIRNYLHLKDYYGKHSDEDNVLKESIKSFK